MIIKQYLITVTLKANYIVLADSLEEAKDKAHERALEVLPEGYEIDGLGVAVDD